MEGYAANGSRRTAGPSSSSSAPDESFRTFLERSFETLAREVPEAYRALCGLLASRSLLLCVDGERVPVSFTPAAARIGARGEPYAVEMRTSRSAILAVIDARATLMSAVLVDRLVLQGAPDDVLAFHDGLMAYVHGAVRARSFPALLRSFRQRRRRTPKPWSGVEEKS